MRRRSQLSRKYHPDAPSTSSSESIESRTSRFQTISQSYHVLSDDALRRSFDQSSSYIRPSYTPARQQSGFSGGSAAAWNTSSSDNAARRDRANYAWMHPTRQRGPTAAEAGASRPDPFQTEDGFQTPMGDHFVRFAAREARARSRATKFGPRKGSPFSSGTEGFGAKAEVCSSGLTRGFDC